MSFSTERKKMIIFHWEKSSVFDSTGSNDSSQTRCLGALATNVLIYAGKRKSETDLRKMIKIMEELLKIEKNEKDIFLTCAAIRKKEQKVKTTFNEF